MILFTSFVIIRSKIGVNCFKKGNNQTQRTTKGILENRFKLLIQLSFIVLQSDLFIPVTF